ncbi:MAG: hypothetical protein MZU91_04340 [Desulfosudis oleivorans]|nr:hypothetical protein [Desulfosudis oleivorans]
MRYPEKPCLISDHIVISNKHLDRNQQETLYGYLESVIDIESGIIRIWFSRIQVGRLPIAERFPFDLNSSMKSSMPSGFRTKTQTKPQFNGDFEIPQRSFQLLQVRQWQLKYLSIVTACQVQRKHVY